MLWHAWLLLSIVSSTRNLDHLLIHAFSKTKWSAEESTAIQLIITREDASYCEYILTNQYTPILSMLG